MSFCANEMQADLQAAANVIEELYQLALVDNQLLRQQAEYAPSMHDYRRRDLMARFETALGFLRVHRVAWQKVPASQRAEHGEVSAAIRVTQDAALKFMTLDRENEQLLLRRGVLPPRHLSSRPAVSQHHAAGAYAVNRQIFP